MLKLKGNLVDNFFRLDRPNSPRKRNFAAKINAFESDPTVQFYILRLSGFAFCGLNF